MADQILELIEKYENENERLQEQIDNDDYTAETLLVINATLEKNNEFIKDLNDMLNTSF